METRIISFILQVFDNTPKYWTHFDPMMAQDEKSGDLQIIIINLQWDINMCRKYVNQQSNHEYELPGCAKEKVWMFRFILWTL